MLARRALALLLVMLLGSVGIPPLPPLASGAPMASLGDHSGSLLGVVGRQVGWLNLVAPRPQILTQLQPPAYATDVATVSGLSRAAVAVVEPFNPGQNGPGKDLLQLDLATRGMSPLVPRSSAAESLGSPAWMPDGSRLFFDRADLTAQPIQYPGAAYSVYPSRVESARPDGSGRAVIADGARMPTVSPDGSQLVYLRSSVGGTALVTRSIDRENEQVLVPATRFTNLGYPRFSPQGTSIAFMAPGAFVAQSSWLSRLPFAPSVGYAHGTPWDVWTIDVGGTNLRQVAELGADDASVSWSPDGSQMLVYGGGGSALVDPVTGETAPVSYLAGYGSTAWIADTMGSADGLAETQSQAQLP